MADLLHPPSIFCLRCILYAFTQFLITFIDIHFQVSQNFPKLSPMCAFFLPAIALEFTIIFPLYILEPETGFGVLGFWGIGVLGIEYRVLSLGSRLVVVVGVIDLLVVSFIFLNFGVSGFWGYI